MFGLARNFLQAIKKAISTPVYEPRGCDGMGCGHFEAPRGSRTHKGFDVKTTPGDIFLSPFEGKVVKLGWVYKGDPKYRIIDIEVSEEMLVRVMYVNPKVKKGQQVKIGDLLGVCQNITEKHGDTMINHAHIEVIVYGEHVNPEHYLRLKRAA